MSDRSGVKANSKLECLTIITDPGQFGPSWSLHTSHWTVSVNNGLSEVQHPSQISHTAASVVNTPLVNQKRRRPDTNCTPVFFCGSLYILWKILITTE